MKLTEPSRKWQEQQHRRVVTRDPIAFAELCEVALDHLVSFLRAQFPQSDSHLHEMITIDLLLDYQKRPGQFDPERLSLLAYLRMAAKRDMLNAIDKGRRRQRRLSSIDDPQIRPELPEQDTIREVFELDEWLQQHTDLSRQEILETLDAEITDPDKRVLLLMLEGVRDSGRYAEIMGITHLDEGEQRKEVKRAKDRLIKKLQRFGKRI